MEVLYKMTLQNKNKQFACPVCGSKYENLKDLKECIATHEKEDEYNIAEEKKKRLLEIEDTYNKTVKLCEEYEKDYNEPVNLSMLLNREPSLAELCDALRYLSLF